MTAAGETPEAQNHPLMRPRKQFKLFALVTALMVVGTLLFPASSATALACRGGGGSAVLVLESFHVTATPDKKTARRGDKVTVKLKVTRPAHEDPVDLGLQFDPPMSTPEKDAIVSVSVWVGEQTYFWDMGLTDANGEETLTLKVPKNSELGTAYASASAYKWLKRDCPDILETGFTEYEKFFAVIP